MKPENIIAEAKKHAYSNATRDKFVDSDSPEAIFLFARKGLGVKAKTLEGYSNAAEYFDGVPAPVTPPPPPVPDPEPAKVVHESKKGKSSGG